MAKKKHPEYWAKWRQILKCLSENFYGGIVTCSGCKNEIFCKYLQKVLKERYYGLR